ncbi:MAG: class I SAM-dependent methyltransferase [Rhodothermales bacterium]
MSGPTRIPQSEDRLSTSPSSAPLLRTLASVPLASRVLDLGCGEGRHTLPLAHLGFDLHACDAAEGVVAEARARLTDVLGPSEAKRRVIHARPDALGYPDAFFDWIVAYRMDAAAATRETLLDVLHEARRVLKPGGWLYLTVPALPDKLDLEAATGYAGDAAMELHFTKGTLAEIMDEARFAEAEAPQRAHDDGGPLWHAIYRRVEAHTAV